MLYGALFFLIGSGIAITRCIAGPQVNVVLNTCARRYKLSVMAASLVMSVTVPADDYEEVTGETQKCLAACIAHEGGFLNADDEFTLSEYVEKEKARPLGEKDTKEKLEKMFECPEAVENWDGWDRKAKCQKGYLFLKCSMRGVSEFKRYMEVQRKIATGELKPRGSTGHKKPGVLSNRASGLTRSSEMRNLGVTVTLVLLSILR